MKLFAHQRHIFEDHEHRRVYEWNQGVWLEVPDEIGLLLLNQHAAKFCDVSATNSPDKHVCPKTKQYMTKPFTAPQNVTLIPGTGRVSKQRLEKRRATYARSRVARTTRAARSA